MVIVIASSKGGSGKTTTTIHLAVCAQLAGETVAIVDCDPQGSALAWASAREAAQPIVAGAEPRDIAKALAKARSAGCSTIVVDTQPRASASLQYIVREADFVVIPVQPSPLDLATGEGTQRVVQAVGKPFAFLLSRCPVRSPDVALSRTTLEAYGGDVFDATIGDRRIYSRSLQTGRSCQEYEPASDASREIAALWDELARRSRGIQTANAV